MTTPLLDQDETQLEWKKQDARNTKQYEQTQAQDAISPAADALSYDTYYNRLAIIRQDSASATAGAIAADNTAKAYEAAKKAAELARQQAAAQQNAYDGMNSIAAGNYGDGSAGWGSGGAQGVANVLRQAGFPEEAIPTMMAIAKAESGWNPSAYNGSNSNGSSDQGLFQINTVHRNEAWYPSNLNDPLQSAKAAYALWSRAGGSYRDWSVYNSGAYKQFLQAAPAAQPYVANTGSAYGMQNAQVGQAKAFTGVPTTSARAQALEISKQVLNIPYVWGGNSLQTGVDCSGLVQQVYAKMGISMPRQSRDQATTGTRVSSYNQLSPGDLVAFKWAGGWAGPNIVSHIAIYIGNGQIIEAAGGSRGDIRSLGNSTQDQGAIYIHTRFPGE